MAGLYLTTADGDTWTQVLQANNKLWIMHPTTGLWTKVRALYHTVAGGASPTWVKVGVFSAPVTAPSDATASQVDPSGATSRVNSTTSDAAMPPEANQYRHEYWCDSVADPGIFFRFQLIDTNQLTIDSTTYIAAGLQAYVIIKWLGPLGAGPGTQSSTITIT